MTNDKLAEAIAYYATDVIQGRQAVILEAARLYHDLPVVDVASTKIPDYDYATEWSEGRAIGWNDAIDHLRDTFPQGLKWK